MTDARTIEVRAGDARYGVHIDGRGRALEAASAHLADVGDAVAQVQDARVVQLHGTLLADAPALDLDGGERAKELDVLGRVGDHEQRCARFIDQNPHQIEHFVPQRRS